MTMALVLIIERNPISWVWMPPIEAPIIDPIPPAELYNPDTSPRLDRDLISVA